MDFACFSNLIMSCYSFRGPPLFLEFLHLQFKTEGFKKRIQKASVSPWPSWVLWTPDTFTFDALGYAFTVPRNDVSDTCSNSLNRVTGDIYWCGQSNISLLANSLWPPAGLRTEGGLSILFYFSRLAKRGGSGYPQALPEVVTLRGC